MRWQLTHGNLLNAEAEALIVSGNPYLNLSGGVGADLLNRYGQAVQTELHDHLKKIGQRYVQPTDVVPTFSGGTPYKVVVHAVAIDAFYDTSPQWVSETFVKAFELAAQHGAKTVAAAALATGYGRMSMTDFAQGIRPLLARAFPPLEQVSLCLSNQDKFEELAALLPEMPE